MSASTNSCAARLVNACGLSVDLNANGSIRRMDCGATLINLFMGNELEGGPANLYLRCGIDANGRAAQYTALLGPRSPTRLRIVSPEVLEGAGLWREFEYRITLQLAADSPAWFWRVQLKNTSEVPQRLDLIYAQDIALAPYGTIRLNEFYVSQYIDHTPLVHDTCGVVVASRQNLAAGGRHPWCVIGSLRHGKSFATDARQLYGLAGRAGHAPVGVVDGLPGRRLQHEHSMVCIQEQAMDLPPQAQQSWGFFGWFSADHPQATSDADLVNVDRAIAKSTSMSAANGAADGKLECATSLFCSAPLLSVRDMELRDIESRFCGQRRHEEFDEDGSLLSFFYDEQRHVVLRAKELQVLRPHGHLLRTGTQAAVDETAMTSTAWMSGVFHSMVTQGHVSFNRLLSTARSYLGLFRSHGLRVFVQLREQWRLLDVPSAFEMTPGRCRWIYLHDSGEIEVCSTAESPTAGADLRSHSLSLTLKVVDGKAARFLISQHIALDGDDGGAGVAANWSRDQASVVVAPAPSSELAQRFSHGHFRIEPASDTHFEQVGGAELLFADGAARQQPYICVVTAPARAAGITLYGNLIDRHADIAEQALSPSPDDTAIAVLKMDPPPGSAAGEASARIHEMTPWFVHNALVHYLSPRGLEQFSGGGWGTRDVCQGPVELLLTSGNTRSVRELLLRVMRAQEVSGDWPQWFMFFERDTDVRAGDSHGDIVFWPVLALSQYIIASGDIAILASHEPFFASAAGAAESSTVWGHVERALGVIERRRIGGTSLAAYGHGDWNDALQPADPAMREHMCSAWTVTLHYQMLNSLAQALRIAGRESDADRLIRQTAAVKADFQRLLLPDGVLAGYASFEAAEPRYLLHPRDMTTGVRYSALAMIHAILEELFTADQAKQHLAMIQAHLSGPDGIRLFDRPMSYHGGPQRLFQRAESAAFFGREIGLMYMHAHLRYAQALAHVGDADQFFHALCQANPIGIRKVVPSASLRQANCYYSSSDAEFFDRYQASAEYGRVQEGTITLDGGWRVYSSGAGIAFGLIVRCFLGFTLRFDALLLDPVMPVALNGLKVKMILSGYQVLIEYAVRGSGCGVNWIALNGERLPLTHESNAYRRGAARIARSVLLERLSNGAQVTIDVG